ncbi:HlyD family type I secretion periplasmic adaptor subunit [Terrarubrum flagellatum]|uniref:HlyD family type I secretion periplasmic adaptor subunit n=1 Tax=Terrirubrum flagellatum TaxID=2895980 RepID=UPI00314509E9
MSVAKVTASEALGLGALDLAPQPSANWKATLRAGHFVIFGLLGGFALWASAARLDGAAVAGGVVEAQSNRKTVQHLEGGIVKDLLVRNGEQVAQDQLLIRLDPVRFEAQADLYRNQLAMLLAQETRLMAEYEMRPTLVLPEEVIARASNPSVAPVVADQTRLFQSRRDELVRNIQVAQSGIDQTAKDLEQNRIDTATATATLASVSQELDSVWPLYQRQLVATSRVTPLEREKLRLQGVIDGGKIQAVKLGERLTELELRKKQVRQDYEKDASTALIDIRKMISDARQQIVLAEDAQKRSEIRAPIAGVVQQLKIFTVGGVIRPGEPILDIAPVNDELVVRAQVQPDDVDRVTADMGAELKFPAFNYWGEKAIRGKVRSISRDRIIENEGKSIYFAAEVVVDKSTLPPDIRDRLLAGMTANVIILTGRRTVADYLVRPLVERFEKSMRER